MGIFSGHFSFSGRDIVWRTGASFIINLTKYRHTEQLLWVAEGDEAISGNYFANLSFQVLCVGYYQTRTSVSP